MSIQRPKMVLLLVSLYTRKRYGTLPGCLVWEYPFLVEGF